MKFTKRIDQKCSHPQNKKVEERERGREGGERRKEGKGREKGVTEMMYVLIVLIAVIISQCRHMSKHQVVPLKYIHLLCAKFFHKVGKKRIDRLQDGAKMFQNKVVVFSAEFLVFCF